MKRAAHRMSKAAQASADDVYDEIDALKSSFKELRGDVVDMMNHALGIGRGSAHVARDTATDAADQVRERFADLRSRGEEQLSAVERRIEERPLSSALLAFGVGFLVAMIYSRR